MDEPFGYYAKWNRSVTNTVKFHLYEVPKSSQIHRKKRLGGGGK